MAGEHADDTAYAYTPAEAGARLGVSADTVRRMVAAGELQAIAVWGRMRITHRALLAYLADREYAAAGLSRPASLAERRRRRGA